MYSTVKIPRDTQTDHRLHSTVTTKVYCLMFVEWCVALGLVLTTSIFVGRLVLQGEWNTAITGQDF